MDQPDVRRTMTYVSTAMEIARDHVYRSDDLSSCNGCVAYRAHVEKAARQDAIRYALAVFRAMPCYPSWPYGLGGLDCIQANVPTESCCPRCKAIAELEQMQEAGEGGTDDR